MELLWFWTLVGIPYLAMPTILVILAERIFTPGLADSATGTDAAARRWIALAAVAAIVTAAMVAVRFWGGSLEDGVVVPAFGAVAGLAAMAARPWVARWLAFEIVSTNLVCALLAWQSLAGVGFPRDATIAAVAVSASVAVVAGARGTRIAAGTPWLPLPPPVTDPARRSIALATLAAAASTLCLAVVWIDGPYLHPAAVPALGVIAGLAALRLRPEIARWLAGALVATNVVPLAVALVPLSTSGAGVSFLMVALACSAAIAMVTGARGTRIATA